ncbi:MAG TPA: hypothetical protein VM537_17355 [Anaerolineae bacterium]|nr:hypothetical protein [Anaerolineae bacterium]
MPWVIPGFVLQIPPEQHLGFWEWAERVAGLIVPFVTLLLALLVYLVYRKQAGIMETQKSMTATQTALQHLQTATNELLAMASLAPLVVPGRAEAGAYPWRSEDEKVILTNIGRGAAFDLRVSDWSLDEDGVPHEVSGVEPESQFVEPGTDVMVTRNDSSWRRRPSILVLHYSDFRGKGWHTTWNLSPDTGAHEERDCPLVWNPGQWNAKPQTRRFCRHCPPAAP